MRYHQVLFAAAVLASAVLGDLQPAIAGAQIRVGGTGASLEYSRQMARLYSEQTADTEIVVEQGLGSSGSIRAVGAGALDVAISGRPLKEKESGQGLVATPLLVTPFGFFTSRHDPISVNAGDLANIYGHSGEDCPWFGSETVRVVLRPQSDSDLALAAVYFPGLGDSMEIARHRPGVPVAQTDQDNAMIAEGIPNSLTTGTLLQMVAEQRDLRPVLLDGVEPALETMRSGAYRYTKTFYLVRRDDAGAQVRRFAAYFYSDAAAERAGQIGAEVIR